MMDARSKALNEFTDYFARNYPGPETIIGDPHWHAPKIFRAAEHALRTEPFQAEVKRWLVACFGEEIASDKVERNHRFIEEALELVQACGCTASEAHQLVDYVFGRPKGEMEQEVGGAMNTLAALCLAHDLDMMDCAAREIARCWTKVEAIRAKQAAKQKNSPLPAERPDPTLPMPSLIELSNVYRFAYTDYVRTIIEVGEELPYSQHLKAQNLAIKAILNAVRPWLVNPDGVPSE